MLACLGQFSARNMTCSSFFIIILLPLVGWIFGDTDASLHVKEFSKDTSFLQPSNFATIPTWVITYLQIKNKKLMYHTIIKLLSYCIDIDCPLTLGFIIFFKKKVHLVVDGLCHISKV